MLFLYEFKKILKRIAPIWILVFVLSVSSVTIIISAVAFNNPKETVNNIEVYTKLQQRIENWDEPRQEQMSTAFGVFYEKYKIMNASTYNSDLVINYREAKDAFQNFYLNYYKVFIDTAAGNDATMYLLVRENHFEILDEIMTSLDFFLSGEKNEQEIRDGLVINTKWEDATLQEILNTIYVQKIAPEELIELQNFFATNTPSNDAYDYAFHKYMIAVSNASVYTGQLSSYDGFNEFVNEFTSNGIMKLAEKKLDNKEHGSYSDAFSFGDIFNNSGKVSIFDFIFTNIEMAAIPIIILVIILSACAFFTDIYQNTIITTISTRRSRTSVIISKTLAVFALTVGVFLLFSLIYGLSSLIFFGSYLAPDILCLFNGTTPLIISQIIYFILYFLSQIFKFMFFIAIAGLFSFSKADPRVIVGLTVIIAIITTLLNGLLGNFAFYQFVPILALDPIKYFGAKMFISPTPPSFNIFFTLPVMLILVVYFYWQLVHNFKRRDFQ